MIADKKLKVDPSFGNPLNNGIAEYLERRSVASVQHPLPVGRR